MDNIINKKKIKNNYNQIININSTNNNFLDNNNENDENCNDENKIMTRSRK